MLISFKRDGRTRNTFKKYLLFIMQHGETFQSVRDWTQFHKDFALISLCGLVACGNYYCYDMPGALNVELREWLGSDYKTYQTQINLLYSAYSLPNIILPFIGGVLLDSLSPTVMILCFSMLVCLGQALFTIGIGYKNFWLMLCGRFVFGLGAESLDVGYCN
jgi:MFS family permease